jgi:hypothetical protein
VHPKIAQTLARHSTITLTLDRYTHVGLYDLSASVNSLPAISVEVPDTEAYVLKATGTEDRARIADVTSCTRLHRKAKRAEKGRRRNSATA